jgi:hypothetical protein
MHVSNPDAFPNARSGWLSCAWRSLMGSGILLPPLVRQSVAQEESACGKSRIGRSGSCVSMLKYTSCCKLIYSRFRFHGRPIGAHPGSRRIASCKERQPGEQRNRIAGNSIACHLRVVLFPGDMRNARIRAMLICTNRAGKAGTSLPCRSSCETDPSARAGQDHVPGPPGDGYHTKP